MSTIETCPDSELGIEPLRDDEIELWNEEFGKLEPTERIEVAHRRLGGCVIAASTFGPTAPILLKALSETENSTPVVTVRHHHETLKTLGLVKWYTKEFGLNLHVKDAPVLRVPPIRTAEFAEFQQRVKVEPFQEILQEHQPQAYFSGRMHWQLKGRRDLPFVERKGDVVAINPVVDISYGEAEDIFDVTYWPRDLNYFDPTKGPDQNLECGLNTTNYEFNNQEEQ